MTPRPVCGAGRRPPAPPVLHTGLHGTPKQSELPVQVSCALTAGDCDERCVRPEAVARARATLEHTDI